MASGRRADARLAQRIGAAAFVMALPWIACGREPGMTKMTCTLAKGCPPSYVCTDTGSGWYCKSPRDGGPAGDAFDFTWSDANRADGAVSVDGQSSGGGIGSGGARGSGGAIGTDAAVGPDASDVPMAVGGVSGSGGATAVGGATNTGGVTATGGSHASGGASGSGGSSSTGGVTSTGGATSTGGSRATGGTGGSTTGADAGPLNGSTGCGKTSTLTFGTVPGESGSSVGTGQGGYVTIQSSGQSRGFAMRLPDNYDSNHPSWLIFAFHWNGGTSKDVDSGGTTGYFSAYFGLQKQSNNGAIFVAPQGNSYGWANLGGQDLTFVDDMVKLIEDNYCVDTTHVVANGFSYGGGMSYEIACARTKVFRAAAIYEGALLSGCDGGNDPIALWQMVGLTDTVCGMGSATPIRDRFVKNNGCVAQSPPQPPSPPPYLNPGGHICTDYAGCSSGHPLRWCVHQSSHGWAINDGTSDLYDTTMTTWVSANVWQWLTSL